MTKDQILAMLPKLSHADLLIIHNMAGHLLGAGPGAVDVSSTYVNPVVFDALVRALGLTMGPSNLPTAQLKQFNSRADWLIKWLDENFDHWKENKVVQLAFLTMLFELLVKDLRKLKIQPTIGVIITHMVRMPKVVDNAFPGYLKAGMGNMIFDKAIYK